MRFKQRLKVIQSLEDTAKRSVVWMEPGSRGPRARAGAGVGMGPKWTASAEPPQTALRSGVQGPQHCPGWDWDPAQLVPTSPGAPAADLLSSWAPAPPAQAASGPAGPG